LTGTRSFFLFAVSGLVATAVDIVVTLAMIPWTPHYLWANTAGFVVANLVQFTIVHRWAFRETTRLTWRQAYLASLAISAAGLVISNVLVWLLVELAGAHIVPAKMLTAGATLVFNYGLRRMLIYPVNK
jgi:putative flippase GtrA